MAQIGETELDVSALSRALWRRSWLLILLAALAGAGTYYALGKVEPLYTADTSILIEERESPLTRPRDQGAPSTSEFDESAIQSQVEVLRSREIAEAVIDKLDLTRRPEFDPSARPSLTKSIRVMLGLDDNPTTSTIRQRVMEGYSKRLTVYPVQKSRVIAIEFVASSPALAAEVANAIAEAFVSLQQDAKRQSAVAATEWLQQEIERLRGRVAEAEQAVATYRTGNELFEVGQGGSTGGGQGTSSLSTQQLSELNAELARARAARAEAEARAESIQTLLAEGGAADASEDVLNSQLIQRLRERQVALRAQIAELSTTLLPGHPRIRSLGGQLGNLEGQIRQEAEKVLQSIRTAARVAAARENSLMTSLNSAKGDVSRSNDQGIELRALEREATAQRELLESFLARYREAVARTDADYLPADARIISRAAAPQDPSYPKKAMMSVAAALAMFLVAAAILLMREFTSGRAFRIIGYGLPAAGARPPEPGSLLVAAVPVAASRSIDLVAEPDPDPGPVVDLAAPTAAIILSDETMENVEDSQETRDEKTPEAAAPIDIEGDKPGTIELGEILASPDVRVALFAGAEGGEGAGDIAFAAARHAAGEKLRLVLIDVGAKPSAALGGSEKPGLGDLLGGEAAFGEVIRRDEGSRVHTIPLGTTDTAPPLQRLQVVVGALMQTYDRVILVADALSDWPDEHFKPDIAAIVCGPEMTESMRTSVYEATLSRGAENALIVRYTGDGDSDHGDRSRAA